MTEEQFARIVEAISTGKYSWACLLILRFAGYNPLHYIPYRTYNRLVKTHQQDEQGRSSSPTRNLEEKSSPRFQDLACLEEIDRQSEQILGRTKFSSIHSARDLPTFQVDDLRTNRLLSVTTSSTV